jgi:hypothetical protein
MEQPSMISTSVSASNMVLDALHNVYMIRLKDNGGDAEVRYLRKLLGKTVIDLDRINISVCRSELLNE